MSAKAKILLTTPDYPPLLGGLSTFTLNLEKCLKQLDVSYELLHWRNFKQLKEKKIKETFDLALNIHFFGAHFGRHLAHRHVNFIHGSEVLFYSPNVIKRMIKRWLKKDMLRSVENAYSNIFISKFTLDQFSSLGGMPNYARDIVFHNCIDSENNSDLENLALDEGPLTLICICRDVPHKNLDGVYAFAKALQRISVREIILHWPREEGRDGGLSTFSTHNIADTQRDNLYRKAHFNLLFSLDHSRRGFVEGFGLTVLEAGKFGTPSLALMTGGLGESVHHQSTGFLFKSLDPQEIASWWAGLNGDAYKKMRHTVFEHTTTSHSLPVCKKLLSSVLGGA